MTKQRPEGPISIFDTDEQDQRISELVIMIETGQHQDMILPKAIALTHAGLVRKTDVPRRCDLQKYHTESTMRESYHLPFTEGRRSGIVGFNQYLDVLYIEHPSEKTLTPHKQIF